MLGARVKEWKGFVKRNNSSRISLVKGDGGETISDRSSSLRCVTKVIKVGLTLLEYQNSRLGAAGRQDQILQSFEFLAKGFRYYLKASVGTLEEMINI